MNQKITEVIRVLTSTQDVSLGTVEAGYPFVSSTGFLYWPDKEKPDNLGKVYLLLSDLARHAKNIKQCEYASLLVSEPKQELPVHERKRVTLKAQMKLVSDDKLHMRLKLKYMDIFPRSEIFFTLSDFKFYEAIIEEFHWIGGFGEAATWSFPN